MVTGNINGMTRRNAAMERELPAARVVALQVAIETVFGHVYVAWRRDTHRSWNGWAQALHDVGVNKYPVEPLATSSRHEQYVEALEQQAAYWAGKVEHYAKVLYWWYESKGRSGGSYHAMLTREKRKAERKHEKAVEHLNRATGGDAVIFLDEGGWLSNKYVRGNRLSRVLDTPLGGEGYWRITGGGGRGGATIATLRNRELHAKWVERRDRVLFKATGKALTGTGIRRVNQHLLRRMEKAGAVRRVA